MQGYKNSQDAQEETPMEKNITLSTEEYQRMIEAVKSMERGKGEENNGKSVIYSANAPQSQTFFLLR